MEARPSEESMPEFSRDEITVEGFYEFRRVERPAVSWVLWVFLDPIVGPVVNAEVVDVRQVPLFGLIGWEWSGPIEKELPSVWPEDLSCE